MSGLVQQIPLYCLILTFSFFPFFCLGQKKSTLCLPNYEQIVLQEASSLGLLSSSSTCQKSPKRFSSSNSSVSLSSPTSSCTLSHSPLSPIMTEKFDWPDVRELRSRYSCQVATEKCRPLVNRSCSAPEKMVDDAKMRAGLQCSKGIAKTDVKSQQWDKHSCRRKGSLDSIPKELVCDTPKELCVTAEASLENNQHVIVIEKLPKETNKAKADEGEPQIRSSLAQEKLSLKELMERYKSYQDSEEHHRHEGDVQEAWWEKTAGGQNNLVKNLREKFQTRNSTSWTPTSLAPMPLNSQISISPWITTQNLLCLFYIMLEISGKLQLPQTEDFFLKCSLQFKDHGSDLPLTLYQAALLGRIYLEKSGSFKSEQGQYRSIILWTCTSLQELAYLGSFALWSQSKMYVAQSPRKISYYSKFSFFFLRM